MNQAKRPTEARNPHAVKAGSKKTHRYVSEFIRLRCSLRRRSIEADASASDLSAVTSLQGHVQTDSGEGESGESSAACAACAAACSAACSAAARSASSPGSEAGAAGAAGSLRLPLLALLRDRCTIDGSSLRAPLGQKRREKRHGFARSLTGTLLTQ